MNIDDFLRKWNSLEPWVMEHFQIRPEQFGSRPRLAENHDIRFRIEAGICTTLGSIYDHVEVLPLHNYSHDAQVAIEDGLSKLDEKLTGQKNELLRTANARRRNGKPIAVILAGAGFSAGFGLPTTESLAKFAGAICQDVDGHLWKYFPQYHERALAEGPLSKLGDAEKCTVNLEEVLTVWDAYREQWREATRWTSETNSYHQGLLENLVAWFHFWSKEAESSEATRATFECLAAWLRMTSEDYDVRIITFNYDLVFERLCTAAGLPYRYLFSPADADAVLIRKLHGSINWIQSDHEITTTPPSEFIGAAEDRYCYGVLTTDHTTFRVAGELPLIIPPSGFKSYDAAFRNVWYWAEHDILSADRLLVVGYSFPELDVLANTELASWIRNWLANEGRQLRYILPRGVALTRIVDRVLKGCANVLYVEEKWSQRHFEEWLGN